MDSYPTIIQGGMGVGVSGWRLARAVSRAGQLGVVSGTALDEVMARRLQEGDPGGHIRRALDAFPFPEIADRLYQQFYVPGGKGDRTPYQRLQFGAMPELYVLANFVEIWLAREGHQNPVGINYLEKIQIPHLASIYGAMLAGVDYVLMGAGIPLKIPGILDAYVHHEPATYPLSVVGGDEMMEFRPRDLMGDGELPCLKRPKFLAIIASNTLAVTMLKKANGRVDGFVIEGPIAGGHNAPPRGKMQLDQAGEPIYGERDRVDLEKIRELGVPFWLAGGYGNREKVQEALAAGATGVQVGTAFAFCFESDLRADYKYDLIEKIRNGDARVVTDPLASPTGFPFKVLQLETTNSNPEVYQERPRICDLGYLREAYRTESGEVDFRCSGEPVTVYVAKGGKAEFAEGRKCLCNGLMANIGHGQRRNGSREEHGLVTAGNDVPGVIQFLRSDGTPYTAADVVQNLLGS